MIAASAAVAVLFVLLDAPIDARADMVGKPAPEIGGDVWVNSAPRTVASLRGDVVLVEFWTFGCYNCRNVEPYVKTWHDLYAASGLVIVGVHTPEFAREKDVEAVRAYLRDHDIRYPVVLDNGFSTWNRYGNQAWPALYLVDKRGRIRHVQIGEGGYAQTERAIQELLAES